MRAEPSAARKSPYHWSGTRMRVARTCARCRRSSCSRAGRARREDQRAFLIHVLRRVIGRRNAVADVGLVRLGDGGEQMLALEEDRHQEGVIGRMRVAEIGVVVQERVALGEVAS